MNASEITVCGSAELSNLLDSMALKILESRRPGAPLRMVGIHSRGVPLAHQLAERLRPRAGGDVLVGAVDITLYRDDLGRADHWPVLRGTEISFDVEGTEVILVDDVVFTGRTVRAALNAVCDLGRPACIRLAALVDRGHREIPIQPDVVGLVVATELRQHVRVRIRPIDPRDEIVRVDSPETRS